MGQPTGACGTNEFDVVVNTYTGGSGGSAHSQQCERKRIREGIRSLNLESNQ